MKRDYQTTEPDHPILKFYFAHLLGREVLRAVEVRDEAEVERHLRDRAAVAQVVILGLDLAALAVILDHVRKVQVGLSQHDPDEKMMIPCLRPDPRRPLKTGWI